MVTVVNVFLHFPGNLVRSSHHLMDQRQASLNIIPVSDTVESPRVRVQRPGLEITIGGRFRFPVADDHRGIASDRQPIRDRKAADDGLGQVADQRDACFAVATVREDEPCRRADSEDFPERIADQVIDRAVLQLEDGDWERPGARRSQRTRRCRGQDTPSVRQAAPGQDTPWRQLSSPLRRTFPQPRWSARWSRLPASRPVRLTATACPPPAARECGRDGCASVGEIFRGHQFLSSSSATSTGGKPRGYQTPVSSRASIRPERLRRRVCLALVAMQARHGPVLCGGFSGQSGAPEGIENKRPRMGIQAESIRSGGRGFRAFHHRFHWGR